jgi:hypothetical protein
VISLINGHSSPSEEGWLTLPEAAAKLGIAVITLRRRLKEGAYEAKQVPGPHGPQWMIRLINEKPEPTRVIVAAHQVDQAGEQADQGEADQADKPDEAQNGRFDKADQGTGDQAALLEALKLVRELQVENRSLAGQVGFLQAQLIQSQGQLEQAQQTIKALEAPKVEEVEQERREEPLPWWKAWLRALS